MSGVCVANVCLSSLLPDESQFCVVDDFVDLSWREWRRREVVVAEKVEVGVAAATTVRVVMSGAKNEMDTTFDEDARCGLWCRQRCTSSRYRLFEGSTSSHTAPANYGRELLAPSLLQVTTTTDFANTCIQTNPQRARGGFLLFAIISFIFFICYT